MYPATEKASTFMNERKEKNPSMECHSFPSSDNDDHDHDDGISSVSSLLSDSDEF